MKNSPQSTYKMKYTEADLKIMFDEGVKFGVAKTRESDYYMFISNSEKFDSSLKKLKRIKNSNLTKYNPSFLRK